VQRLHQEFYENGTKPVEWSVNPDMSLLSVKLGSFTFLSICRSNLFLISQLEQYFYPSCKNIEKNFNIVSKQLNLKNIVTVIF
jgi:hypothetical protein